VLKVIFSADLSSDIVETEKILGIKYLLEFEGVVLVGSSGEILKF